MRKYNSCLALLLTFAIMLSLGGCGRKTATGHYVDESEISELDDYVSQDEVSGDNNSKGGTNTSGSGGTGTASGNASTVTVDRNKEISWKIERDVSPQASGSIMKNLNFKGKKLRMLVYNSNYTAGDKAIVEAFQKKYNCKIEVDIVNYEDYPTIMSSSLSAGKPYDIIRLHEGFFPLIGVAKLGQPLETAISKEDLSSSSKKEGICWDATYLTGTWDNHVYLALERRTGPLWMMIYNKLLFRQYGLEDPMELYKKGQWTVDKIIEMAKTVNASGSSVKFHNDAVSQELARLKYPMGATYIDIANDGTVSWLGANSKIFDFYNYERSLRELATLSETTASVQRIVNGECMLDISVGEQMNNYISQFKSSQAFGKDVKNVGFVPVPFDSEGKYLGLGVEGFAAARGCDPKAAVAMTVFYSMQNAAWSETQYPELAKNVDIFEGLYDKARYRQAYVFRAANGKKADELIYPMYGQIDNGGDIMRLAQEYAPIVKSAVEYTLSQQ